MEWLHCIDLSLFRFINTNLVNPVFDLVMPFVSGNAFFYPILFLAAYLVIWKGRMRGLIFVALLALILPLGDTWVCRTIKNAVARPRPFAVLEGVHRPGVKQAVAPLRIGEGEQSSGARTESFVAGSGEPQNSVPLPEPRPVTPVPTGSMPSSHAANWFAATMLGFIYYRRSVWFLLPAACLVGFSRIYNGVHYPSDVLAGAVLGAGYAAAAVWTLDAFWEWAGKKWFPLWWRAIPSLIALRPASPAEEEGAFARRVPGRHAAAEPPPHVDVDVHWLRLGYLTVIALLVARLVYIGTDIVQLTGDEAYQWLWSKHLALSYYSKPPLIAYAQFLGTALFGDTEFGVRFFSPVCAALLSLALLRFFQREFNARAGFFLLLIVTATPLISAGAVLMTVDAFSVLFWTLAMVAGWRAVQPNSSMRDWAWVGVWMGAGFLSKYTELLQWLSWVVFFLLWPQARQQLRRPGLYVALGLNALCSLPVLIWNQQHQWVTVGHVAGDAKAGEGWSPAVLDFLASEALLLNPIFFVAMIWAAVTFWRRSRYNPRLIYLFCMGAPLFLVYFVYSFHSRLQPNWIAPSVLPLFCLMVAYGDTQWRLGLKPLRVALYAGLAIGLPVVIVAHQTELIGKFIGHLLPVNQDPLHRARGWKEVARVAEKLRGELVAEGKPVFFIAGHYRLAGELAFYLPRVSTVPASPVYCRSSPVPVDQFYFWPGYENRKGENAILVWELSRDDPRPKTPPVAVTQEFESTQDLGIREVLDHGRVLWRLQFFACRGLK